MKLSITRFWLLSTLGLLSFGEFGSYLSGQSPVYNFSTFAGANGLARWVDGSGSAARLFWPDGLALDRAGNIYVADYGNHTIRRITPGGVVTTIVGIAGRRGFQNGSTATALLDSPRALAVDSVGNIYFTDGSKTIRKITPTGVVSTIAGGADESANTDGQGGAARFGFSAGMALSSTGDIYVCDTGQNTIRKVTPAGLVTTFAGRAGESGSTDGQADSARFFGPRGLAFDSSGNLYVADSFNNLLRKITPAGIVTTVAGSVGRSGFAEGTGSTAVFGFLSQLTLDAAGNIYATDGVNHIIWKITAAGAATRFSGVPTSSGSADGATTTARFDSPDGIVGAANGTFYVADSNNNTVRVVSGEGSVTTLAGKAGLPSFADGTGGAARFDAPYGITLDSSGNLYVTDFGNAAVRKITPQAAVTSLAPPGSNIQGGIVRLANGDVYVTSQGPNRVIRISASGTTTTFAGPDSTFPDPGNGYIPQFILPRGIIADREENLYVADEFNSVIRKITPSGVISNWAGTINRYGSFDGSLADAHFGYPRGLAIDVTGNIYVADTRNSTIRKITAAGQVSTLAGLAGFYGFEDGVGATARFNQPDALTVDQSGNVFVADTGNRTIRRITPEGVVTTVGGFPGLTGNSNGPSAVARFSAPTGIAIDSNGSLYIVDQDNNSIRKGTPIIGASPPVIVTQPQNQTAFAGSVVVFSVTSSSGLSSTFQWYFNGRPILGATGSSYAIFSATPSEAGNYTAFVSNGQGITMSAPAVLTVDPNPNPNPQTSQIINISTRSFVGQGASAQIAGFVIGGTEPKPVFIRANGPALTQFGLTGVLSDPKITLNSSTSVIAENDDWHSVPADRDQILSIINQRNLFGFTPGSKDAALVVTLAPGNYTAIVSGNNGTTGVALIEVYDLATAANQSKLINISTRTEVRSGAEVAIGGFIISGVSPKTVLVRAGGPSLAQFGVPGLLADPTLTIYSGQTVIAQNDDWESPDSSAVLAVNQRAGAFPFVSGSKDAALVIVLQPGPYTAIVSGKNGANGVALLEVYEVQ